MALEISKTIDCEFEYFADREKCLSEFDCPRYWGRSNFLNFRDESQSVIMGAVGSPTYKNGSGDEPEPYTFDST